MVSTYSVPEKENKIRKGRWRSEEDTLLINYISFYGEGRWDALAKGSGLQRNGKSCRLRWVNYLRPGLKGTKLSKEEERLVIDLHQKWGNTWSRIVRYLPGRTDNEIKNFFRSHYRRKLKRSKECNGKRESAICGFCRDGSSICVEKMPYLGAKSNIVVNQYKESQVFGHSSSSPCHSLLESSLTCIDFYEDEEVSFLNVTSSSDSISEVFMDYTDQLWTIQEDCRVSSV